MSERNWMKVEIGAIPDRKFRVIGRSGSDITEELDVEKVAIYAKSGELTRCVLTVCAEVEVEASEVEMNVDKVEPPVFEDEPVEEVSG